MKVQSQEFDYVTLTRAEDGVEVAVPNGTKVTVLDDMGDDRRLMTEHVTSRDDWPCMYEGEMYFVDRRLLVRRNA